MSRPQHDGGDILVEEDGEGGNAGGETVPIPDQSSSPLVCSFSSGEDGTASAAPLPRVIAAAAVALEASRRGDRGRSIEAGGGESVEGVRRRLEETLQQVAVHRVQQIYAHLNGIAALEAAEEVPTITTPLGEEGEREDEREAEKGAAAAAEGNDAQFEEEARGLVAFACKACGDGGSQADGSVRWGDEDLDSGGGGGGGASWSMMMPYLPVWVGFAGERQVSWCRTIMVFTNGVAATTMCSSCCL